MIVAFLTTVIAAVAVAWAARRLLGARDVSWTRTVVAAAIGLGTGWLTGALIVRSGIDDDEAAITATVLAVLVTMIALVALELLARPRLTAPTARPRARNPIRAAQQRLADARRLRDVVAIAQRNGMVGVLRAVGDDLDDAAADELGRRLRSTLEEAGGVFVKLGQLLSTRPDVLPAATVAQLAGLQGDVPAAPRDVVEPELAAALGRPVGEVFSEFDWAPLGAASLGQVYRARLVGGDEVVVKVRRPGIVDLVERDLGIVLELAGQADRRVDVARQSGALALAEGFAADLRAELDYANEARQTQLVAATFASERQVHVPSIHDSLTSESVLVMDLVPGTPIGRIDPPVGGRDLADRLFRRHVEAMVSGETFHADPHPGNVLLMPDGRLGLIDCGATARLDSFERSAVTDLLLGLHLRDPAMLREAIASVSDVPDGVDPVAVERALARLLVDQLGTDGPPTVELVAGVLVIVRRFRIRLPGSILGVFRSLGTLTGTVEALDPSYNVIEAAREFAGDRIRGEIRPDNAGEALRNEVLALAPLLRRAPRHLDRIAGQLERGELTTRTRIFSHPDDVAVVSRLANRFILAFLGAALGLVSVLLFRTVSGPAVTDELALYELFGFVGLLTGAVLVMRVVLESLQERTRT